jgi:hypothetical protein
MKKFLIAQCLLTSVSTFASGPVKVQEVKLTSYGAKITVSYEQDRGQLGIPLASETTKTIICTEEDGQLIANMEINHRTKAQQALTTKIANRKFKIKIDGLCNGRTPDSLIVNGVTVL